MFLVVDDDRDTREVIVEFLESHGFTGRSAKNGKEALHLLRERTRLPELILLDLVMPVMDGWGFLAERSRDSSLWTIPVIVVSSSPGIEERAGTAGAQDALSKPIQPKALLSAIEPFLGSSRPAIDFASR
jgi:two-component system chemotaxis response regulator CheY